MRRLCFERVFTKDSVPTMAYKFARTIKDEVWSVQKETSFKMWKIFTSPPQNPRLVIEHLKDSTQAEFPLYDVRDGHWYSFENGVYNIRFDLFPYDQRHRWSAIAAAVHGKRLDEAKRRLEVARDAYDAEPESEACFFEQELWRNTIDDMGAAYPHPTSETVCVNHFEIDFRFDIEAEEAWGYDCESYQADELDKVFEHQQYQRDSILMAKTCFGRCLFPPKALEAWAKCLILLGMAASGKSTAAVHFLMHVLPAQFYSLMNANFEEKFGMSGITGEEKRLCFCEEMTEDLSVKQEEWQLFAEAGVINVAEKGVTAKPHQVKQHLVKVRQPAAEALEEQRPTDHAARGAAALRPPGRAKGPDDSGPHERDDGLALAPVRDALRQERGALSLRRHSAAPASCRRSSRSF